MAGVRFGFDLTVNVSTASLTIFQIIAAAQQRVKIERIRISGKGTSNTDAPTLWQLMTQTGGTASSMTLNKLNVSDNETLQTTAKKTFTVEPTYSTIKAAMHIHPQTWYDIVFPYGRELWVGGGEILGLVAITPTQANTWCFQAECEE